MIAQAWRLARRELRGGLRGFRIFIACLALGVAAIAAVQSVAGGILDGLREDGRAILGGDIALRLIYRPASDAQQDWLRARGRVAEGVEMRAMAIAGEGRSTLVELKAVDGAYPLYGTATLRDGAPVETALAQRDGAWGVAAEEAVLDRLGLSVGERVRVGDAEFVLRGVIAREPDKAGSGAFTLGPRLMVPLEALAQTGLLQPGSLVNWTYRLALPPGSDVAAVRSELAAAFPDAGWRVRDYTDAAPQLQQFINRLALFLTLVGLTALLVGGVGVGNAVRAYLDGKVETIATLKTLGAPGRLVFATYLLQVTALAAIGIAIGLVIGALVPPLAAAALEDVLPVPARVGLQPAALVTAAAFGLLTALAFSLWPLGRAGEIPAAALFRDAVAPVRALPRQAYVLGAGASALGLAALAIATAPDRSFAAWFVAGAFVTLLAFRGAAWLVTHAAARAGRPRNPGLRLALANLHRPGNPTGSVVLSLGLGLTVLVAIALVEGNFSRRLQEAVPSGAPSFFFIDVQPDQRERLFQAVQSVPGAEGLMAVPSLRGRIATVNGVEAEKAVVDPSEGWVARGDRGLTYSAELPSGSRLVAGEWWPRDYAGPPLISVIGDVARAFGVGPGDRLGITILGRTMEARIANVREVDFSSLNINFALVFAPGLLEGAPQTWIATLRATPEAEPEIQRLVARSFPNVTTVRVKDALDQVNALLGQIGTGVRLTAAVTLIAGTLVLAGAVAAGHRRRVYDAVVLKVLGATRGAILRAFMLEYGLLGIVTAVIAGAIGTLAAWAVLIEVMRWDRWVFLPASVLGVAALCTVITLAFGFVGTWRALGQPAAPLLRNE
ncbi:ABC transporter permease [Arenibaculum pallidiluteum]|uniref:ABC transporter permease n=1 Tax=Arenibaculum pallidiluteum TaxID=2812559 RepID=UPI001A964237|nr:FtsX-like permease family protein [Arenibaculum pallidiluteum]